MDDKMTETGLNQEAQAVVIEKLANEIARGNPVVQIMRSKINLVYLDAGENVAGRRLAAAQDGGSESLESHLAQAELAGIIAARNIETMRLEGLRDDAKFTETEGRVNQILADAPETMHFLVTVLRDAQKTASKIKGGAILA